MTEVIREYGAAIIAALGGILLLAVLGQLFFSGQGMLAQMIAAWGNGGC